MQDYPGCEHLIFGPYLALRSVNRLTRADQDEVIGSLNYRNAINEQNANEVLEYFQHAFRGSS